MTELYVDPAHRIPDEDWAEVVRRAQEIHSQTEANKAGGAASPAGLIVDLRGRSNKHSGVSGLLTQLLVLHSAECPLRGGYALSLTEWAINTAVVASWQRFIDPFHRVYMIDDNYAAWHASEANPMSIGWEQAGYARFSREEWLTPDGLLMMESLAYDMAEVAVRDGISAVWLTTEQVTAITSGRDRTTKGFCLHRQIDPETRTDPGDGYPYDLLMAKIRTYMSAIRTGTRITSQPGTTTNEQDDEMYVIFSDSAVNDGKVWIGNGIVRRHIPDPDTLEAMQKLAKEGVLNIKDGGIEHNLPLEAMGMDVVQATAAATIAFPFTYREPRTDKPKGTTNIGAALGGSDLQHVATRDEDDK